MRSFLRTKSSRWKLILKICFTAGAFYWIGRQIDFTNILSAMMRVPLYAIIAALVLFNLSKLVSAIRLHHVFRAAGVLLSGLNNLRLYYKSMFYNLFLPGGIGGDGYKVLYLTQTTDRSWKQLVRAIFWDRLTGVLGLFLLTGCLLLLHPVAAHLPNAWTILVLACVLALLSFQILTRLFFEPFSSIVIPSITLGFVVQALQMTMAAITLTAMNVSPHLLPDYLLLFLLSSLATVIPLTIGGSGVRELVFVAAAQYTSIEEEKAITFSLIFYAIGVASSLAGSLVGNKKKAFTPSEA